MLSGAGIHAINIGRAFVGGDRVGEGDGRCHQLAGALGDLADGERRARIHRAGEEVDLVDLKHLVGLLHGDGRVGFLVLEDQFDRTAHDAAGGVHFLGGEFEAPFHLLADAGIGAAQRRHDADLDRIGRRKPWSVPLPTSARRGSVVLMRLMAFLPLDC